MARGNLTPAERDALLETLAENAADHGVVLARIDARLAVVERNSSASPMAILRDTSAQIFASNVRTAAFFVFLTFATLAAAAVWIDSEAALSVLAGRAPTSDTPVLPPPREETP